MRNLMQIVKLTSFLAFFLVVSCQQEENKKQIKIGYTTDTQVEVIYEIQTNNKTIGYAEKYAWEKDGASRHYYRVYNAIDQPVAHILWDGTTKRYLANGESVTIGSFELKTGLQRIFNVDNANFFPAGSPPPVIEQPVLAKEDSQKDSLAKKDSQESTESSDDSKDSDDFGEDSDDFGEDSDDFEDGDSDDSEEFVDSDNEDSEDSEDSDEELEDSDEEFEDSDDEFSEE